MCGFSARGLLRQQGCKSAVTLCLTFHKPVVCILAALLPHTPEAASHAVALRATGVLSCGPGVSEVPESLNVVKGSVADCCTACAHVQMQKAQLLLVSCVFLRLSIVVFVCDCCCCCCCCVCLCDHLQHSVCTLPFLVVFVGAYCCSPAIVHTSVLLVFIKLDAIVCSIRPLTLMCASVTELLSGMCQWYTFVAKQQLTPLASEQLLAAAAAICWLVVGQQLTPLLLGYIHATAAAHCCSGCYVCC